MKYTVSMAVDVRIDVPVEADTPAEAFEKSKAEFVGTPLSKMEVVDAKPVNCCDDSGNIVEEYNG